MTKLIVAGWKEACFWRPLSEIKEALFKKLARNSICHYYNCIVHVCHATVIGTASWCATKTKACISLFSVSQTAEGFLWRLWGWSRRLQRCSSGSGLWMTLPPLSLNTTATLTSMLTVPSTRGTITTRFCFCLYVSSTVISIREVDA